MPMHVPAAVRGLFAALSLLAAVPAAQAALAPDVMVASASGGSALPGGTATTSFTIAFGGTYSFATVATTILYDPAMLGFNPMQSSVAVGGTTYSLPSFLGLLATLPGQPGFEDFTFYGGEDTPGELYFGAGFISGGSVALSGEVVVSTAFDLKPAMVAGSQSNVVIHHLMMADANTGITTLAAPGQIPDATITMTVSAVPEPASWLMMLAGAGLLGAVAQRRTRGRG